jgi:SAM-dependent methyltransferase
MPDRYDHLRDYYGDFAEHAESARRVAWRSADDQHLRFEVLLEAIDDADYPLSVLDVGCGIGALYGYLKASDRVTQYTGIDLLPDMIDRARDAYPSGQFEVADLLDNAPTGPFDLVVCSGALNVRIDDHHRWVQRMLEAMWERARFAVVANFQITRAFRFNPLSKDDPDLVHVEQNTLLSWCEAVTPWFAYRADYLGDDASVYLYKDYHRSVGRLLSRRSSDERSEVKQCCGLAFLLLERRCPKRALAVLAHLAEHPDVLNFRGMCYHRMGDHRAARTCYEGALTLDPDHYEARLNIDCVSRN